MVDLTGCVSIPYFKKAVFTGSCGKMRYLIGKAEDEKKNIVLQVWYWEGPYASDKVPLLQKTTELFPFTEDGISQAVAWLNQALVNFQ